MTKEERSLWYGFLKELPQTINRQKVIGEYIVDFYCASAKLVIEIDGDQHYTDIGESKDRIRTETLEGYGLTVVRFSNQEINKNFNNVCDYIDELVKASLREVAKRREGSE